MADLWISHNHELINLRYVVSMYKTEDTGQGQYFGIRLWFEEGEQRLFTFKDEKTRDEKWALIKHRLCWIPIK